MVHVRGSAKILKVFSSKHDEHLVGASIISGVIEKKSAIRVNRRGTPHGMGSIISIQHNRQAGDRVQGLRKTKPDV